MKTSSLRAARPPLALRRAALQRWMIIAFLFMLLFGAVFSHAAADHASPIGAHPKLRQELAASSLSTAPPVLISAGVD